MIYIFSQALFTCIFTFFLKKTTIEKEMIFIRRRDIMFGLTAYAEIITGQFLLSLGALFMLATIVVFWTVAALGGRLAVWFNSSQRGQIMMQRVAGCVFVGMASALLLSGR